MNVARVGYHASPPPPFRPSHLSPHLPSTAARGGAHARKYSKGVRFIKKQMQGFSPTHDTIINTKLALCAGRGSRATWEGGIKQKQKQKQKRHKT